MYTTWPKGISGSTEIELRIGLLRYLFIAKNQEWLIVLFLAMMPLAVAVLVFIYCFTAFNPGNTWIVGAIALAITLGLIGLSRWYLTRRKYFCICENGCAYGATLDATPVILPWPEVEEIRLEEDAYLKVEEHAVLGMPMSKMMEEGLRNWLHIRSAGDPIRFKLSEFPRHEEIVEQVLEQSKDKEIALEHARIESPELVQAKASQSGNGDMGKKQYYIGGVILFIIVLVIKIAIAANRR
jgi:hypothetical protein